MAEQTLTAQAQYFKWDCWAQRRFHASQNSCLASRWTQSCHHKQKMMFISNSTESQMAGSTLHTQIYASTQTYSRNTSLLTHTHNNLLSHTHKFIKQMYSHTHTCTSVLTHANLYKHTLAFSCTHTHTHLQTHKFTHTKNTTYSHIYTCMHTRTHSHTHANLHTHTHARTHTQT